MIQDYIDMDTQEKIRYISESSNASTSGYSTMSSVHGVGGHGTGNESPASSSMCSMPSPAQSPATALQTEFSNLNLPQQQRTTTMMNQQQQQQQQQHTYTPLQSQWTQQQQQQQHNPYMNFSSNIQRLHHNPLQLQQHNLNMQPFMLQSDPLLALTNAQVKNEYTASLRILEHPVEKFRFRYKSEMHGTHGSLNGANSKRTPKTFPEVELCNFEGHAVVRCSLFQTNIDSPHSHQLVVRKDDRDIGDPHDQHVSPEQGYVVQFQNMGIIHTAKKFIFDELLKKKRDRLLFEIGREELSAKQMQELHKETEKETKEMNLNQVRLCFEAFKIEDNHTWTRIATPVYTNPINNRKSAQTGELRICRLSIASGSVLGGDDLILLVEKVSKKNIKVRFYELNEDEEIVWEAFGRFRESDVHHQYAIVCQTPQYKNKDIDKPVEVCIELVRPSDDERSYPPVTFRYKPRDAIITRKRRRTTSAATNSSGSSSSLNSFELPKTVQEQQTNTATLVMNAPLQIPQMSQAPTMSQHLASLHGHMAGSSSAPTISEEFNKEQQLQRLLGSDMLNDLMNTNSEELTKLCPNSLSDFEMFQDLQPPGGSGASGASGSGNVGSNTGHLETDSVSVQSPESKESSMKGPTKIFTDLNSYLQTIIRIFENLRTTKNVSEEQVTHAFKKAANVYLEHAENSEIGDSLLHELIIHDNPKLRVRILQIFSFFRLNQLFDTTINTNGEGALHIACIYDRALYIRPLLRMGCNPNLQDHNGNTPLHIAVKDQNFNCLESFLNMPDVSLDLSVRNDEGLTALHLAIRLGENEMAKKLLRHDQTAALVCNTKDGNNALHLAVTMQNLELVRYIIDELSLKRILGTPNAAGYKAIEMARTLNSSVGNQISDFLLLAEKENKHVETQESLSEINSKLILEEKCEDEASLEPLPEDLSLPQQITYDIENILNNPSKFKLISELLNESDKWKNLAKKLQMQHLLCLWSSAEDMLNFVRNKSGINNKLFTAALADVSQEALNIFQAT